MVRKHRFVFGEIRATWNRVTAKAKARAYCRGGVPAHGRVPWYGKCPLPLPTATITPNPPTCSHVPHTRLWPHGGAAPASSPSHRRREKATADVYVAVLWNWLDLFRATATAALNRCIGPARTPASFGDVAGALLLEISPLLLEHDLGVLELFLLQRLEPRALALKV